MERTTMRPESQCLHMLTVTPSPEEEAGGLRTIYWRLESGVCWTEGLLSCSGLYSV